MTARVTQCEVKYSVMLTFVFLTLCSSVSSLNYYQCIYINKDTWLNFNLKLNMHDSVELALRTAMSYETVYIASKKVNQITCMGGGLAQLVETLVRSTKSLYARPG